MNTEKTTQPPEVPPLPAPAGSAQEIGKTYKLHHSRFGSATVTVTNLDGEWIDVLVIKGKLRGMTEEWKRGDMKTVRASHCLFAPNSVIRTNSPTKDKLD